jgi:hypothetical protein
VLSGLPSLSWPRRTRSGSSEAPSPDSTTAADVTAIGVWSDGRFIIGEEDGGSEEWISAADPIPRQQKR